MRFCADLRDIDSGGLSMIAVEAIKWTLVEVLTINILKLLRKRRRTA